MFVLTYGQPRPASYDKNVAICEQRTHRIEGDDEGRARQTANAFLKEGAVTCGDKTHRRVEIGFSRQWWLGEPAKPTNLHIPIEECM